MIRAVLSRYYRRILDRGFHPYICTCCIGTMEMRFFVATAQAKDWYDPISEKSKLEYNWLLDNVNLSGQKIIDGGANHGHYSVFLGLAGKRSTIISVDPIEMNLTLTEINMRINDLSPNLVHCAIADSPGFATFENISNSQLTSSGGVLVSTQKLSSILPDATVVKLDIEGSEFAVLPDQIDEMRNVHTWIVEIHTRQGDPLGLVKIFLDWDYQIDWLNQQSGLIEEYKYGTAFNCHHTTVFARKR